MSGVSHVYLGAVPLPVWLVVVVLVLTRLFINASTLDGEERRIMKMINIATFTLTGFAEVVWGIGTKVAAAAMR